MTAYTVGHATTTWTTNSLCNTDRRSHWVHRIQYPALTSTHLINPQSSIRNIRNTRIKLASVHTCQPHVIILTLPIHRRTLARMHQIPQLIHFMLASYSLSFTFDFLSHLSTYTSTWQLNERNTKNGNSSCIHCSHALTSSWKHTTHLSLAYVYTSIQRLSSFSPSLLPS